MLSKRLDLPVLAQYRRTATFCLESKGCSRKQLTPSSVVRSRADREDGDRDAACPAEHRRRQEQRMEEQHAANLSTSHACRRCSDRRLLSRPAPIRAVCAARSAPLFGGAVGKDTVSRVWRKVKSDWDAWNARSNGFAPRPSPTNNLAQESVADHKPAMTEAPYLR